MRPGEDPHIYEPRPMDAIKIRQARVVLQNGLHLEGTLHHIIENNLSKRAILVALGEAPEIKVMGSLQYKGAPDPHVWMNVAYFKVMARKCKDALIKADPEGREIFEKAASLYLQKLDQLHQFVKERLATIPKERRILITTHDAFQYFGRAYDIEVHGLIGISTEQEPRPQDVENLKKVVEQKKVKAVFVETSVSSSLSTLMNKQLIASGPPREVYTDQNYQLTYGGLITMVDRAEHALWREKR